MVDWQVHYNTIYNTLGVDAVLTVQSTDGTFDLTVIDKTGGIQVSDDPTVASIKPAAVVRAYELTGHGLNRDDLNGASISFNGASWDIKASMPRPSPAGEQNGEVYLILSDDGQT